MTRPASRRDDLGAIIFDMEDRVCDLVRFGEAVRDLGCCECEVTPGGLYVVGKAMIEAANQVKADWERCFELSRDLRERGR